MYAHQKDSEDHQSKVTDIEDKDQIEQLPQNSEPAKREETLEGKSENELANIKPKPASLGKIMRYYSPKIVAFLVIWLDLLAGALSDAISLAPNF